ALALGPNVAAYAPVSHRAPDPRAGELFASELPEPESAGVAPTSLHADQVPLAAAIALLKPLLEDASVVKVGLNVKWDVALFAKYGIALSPIDDPMLMSYALYGGMDSHEKNDLIEKHLGHVLVQRADVAGKGRAQVSFDLVPIEKAAPYSAEHADAALRLYRKLKPQLARERLITVYETLERPLPPVLADMGN